MAQDKNCPLNIEGICFELVAHGFSEKQLREEGRMKPCNMGKYNALTEITRHWYCISYKAFESFCEMPGVISQRCYDAIQMAKHYGEIDGEIIDLKSKELSTTSSES